MPTLGFFCRQGWHPFTSSARAVCGWAQEHQDTQKQLCVLPSAHRSVHKLTRVKARAPCDAS